MRGNQLDDFDTGKETLAPDAVVNECHTPIIALAALFEVVGFQ